MKIAREPTHLLMNMAQMMIEFSAMGWLTIQLMNLLKNAKTVKHLFGMQHHQRKEEEKNNMNKSINMDFIAKRIVKRYVEEHLDKSDKEIALTDKEPYIVWKCKTLQNWKYLMSTDLHDGMYYEVTYNGDKQEWYLDAYKKFENRCIPMSEVE